MAALEYHHDTFRGQRLKRGYAQFGFAYVITGRKLVAAAALPDFLSAVAAKASPHCPAGTTFNQCIVTWYPSGAGIGWHTDAPVFGDCIVRVSLGGPGRFQLPTTFDQRLGCLRRRSICGSIETSGQGRPR